MGARIGEQETRLETAMHSAAHEECEDAATSDVEDDSWMAGQFMISHDDAVRGAEALEMLVGNMGAADAGRLAATARRDAANSAAGGE